MDGSLYQAHFGLSQAPFNITPDPTFLYLTVSHREGLAQLSYGIRARKGFVVLTGEVGTGKTMLIHALLNDLNGSAQTALIFSTIVTPRRSAAVRMRRVRTSGTQTVSGKDP